MAPGPVSDAGFGAAPAVTAVSRTMRTGADSGAMTRTFVGPGTTRTDALDHVDAGYSAGGQGVAGSNPVVPTASSQVIPEGVGPVKTRLLFLIFSGVVWARRSEVSGSRLGRSPSAERPGGP